MCHASPLPSWLEMTDGTRQLWDGSHKRSVQTASEHAQVLEDSKWAVLALG